MKHIHHASLYRYCYLAKLNNQKLNLTVCHHLIDIWNIESIFNFHGYLIISLSVFQNLIDPRQKCYFGSTWFLIWISCKPIINIISEWWILVIKRAFIRSHATKAKSGQVCCQSRGNKPRSNNRLSGLTQLSKQVITEITRILL